ncbi:MAG: GNAT family N-acetyltransferase [Cyanosarcina radialis HA8281-LM2]|jgi:GNAT superfamily N-acetyltransferase|nr:GNAT family N-acetyltransferase [Cyanosarcina radialis HA8281-LM2]
MSEYKFKRSFAEDSTLSDRLFELLEIVFPGISSLADTIATLGVSWEAASTPFVYVEGEKVIAHVGVLEIPLVVMGKKMIVGGIHAVSTHPEFRRRGYYRQLMTEVLSHCDDLYQTLILTTDQPQLYAPFGFRVVREHAFIAKPTSTSKINSFRLLDLQNAGDRSLLNRLLGERESVSQVVGVVKEKAVWCFYEATNPLYYAEDLDAIASLEIKRTRLKLFDVVAPKICSLDAIVQRIERQIDEVEIYFSPDRLQVEYQAHPHIFEGDSFLMVRGDFAAENQQFMLPRSARC